MPAHSIAELCFWFDIIKSRYCVSFGHVPSWSYRQQRITFTSCIHH